MPDPFDDDPFRPPTPEEQAGIDAIERGEFEHPPSPPDDVIAWIDGEIKRDIASAVSEPIIESLRELQKDPAQWLRVRQVLRRHGVSDAVRTVLSPGPVDVPLGKDPRPQIIIGTDERQIADFAILALSKRNDLYQRGGVLCMINEAPTLSDGIERPKDSPRIVPAPSSQIRSMMAETICWLKVLASQSGPIHKPAHPPDWAVRDVHERGQWAKIRPLLGLAETPMLRPDGSVIEEAGYDEQSAIVYRPSAKYPPVGDPTLDDARAAALELLMITKDFPFASPVHGSAWLAGVLTPLARNAFHGPSPLVLFDANTRGSGKGLLTDVTAALVSGHEMARMSQARDEDEERKRITSIALQGDPMVLIDNLTRPLGSGALDAALTSTIWAERILGSNVRPALPLRTCWYATGNNVQLRGDTSRRCLHVRLESPLQHPEDRRDFEQPNLIRWVQRNRSTLVVQAVRILRAFRMAGSPDQGLRPWGSYGPWSDLVRQALVWVGLEDPGETRLQLRELADSDANALPGIIEGLGMMCSAKGEELRDGLRGVTSRRIAVELTSETGGYEALREGLAAIGCRLEARSIGNRLRGYRRRWVGGRSIDAIRKGNVSYWAVVNQESIPEYRGGKAPIANKAV